MTNNPPITEEVKCKLCTPCVEAFCECNCHFEELYCLSPLNQAPASKEWAEELREKFGREDNNVPGNMPILKTAIPLLEMERFIATLISKARSEAQREVVEKIGEFKKGFIDKYDEIGGTMTNEDYWYVRKMIDDIIRVLNL